MALTRMSGVSTVRSSGPRRFGWWALFAAVLLGHALLTLWLQQNLVGWGEGETPMPQRIEVAFVQTLAPAAPLAPPAIAARPNPKLARARAVAPAASTPPTAASERVPEPIPEPAPEPAVVADALAAPTTAPALPDLAAASASPAASVSSTAASAPAAATAFEWPPSTRLTYVLSGNYRGEVHGSARVQWVRQGARYQVHLDVAIGPSFAPLMSRRMTSDGELGEHGLTPRRYDEATRLPFQQPRRVTLQFTPEQVTLANGSQQEALPGIQDAASQFVQLTWLFTTKPDLLRTGNTVTIPLALPRRVGRWVYDVLGQERLRTPIGELDTFHLKPRLGERRPGNELSAEVWFAPTLQYLPVRIRIQQDADTFIDLLLDAAPLQAAPAPERP
ncbi:MAG: DUF3108 domain-containing protein [Pseudomonadota bacterium]